MQRAGGFISYLFILAALQGAVLALSLWTKKAAPAANRLLATWLLLVVADLLMVAAIMHGLHLQYPVIMYAKHGWPFLHGPMLYLYTADLTHPRQRSLRDLWHFFPFVSVKLVFIPFLFLSHQEQVTYIQRFAQNAPLSESIFSTILALHGLAYVIFSFFTVRHYRRQAVQYFSYAEKVSLSWLSTMLIINLAIWGIVVANRILFLFGAHAPFDVYTYTLAAIWVFTVGYFGFHQPRIFTGTATGSSETYAPPPDTAQLVGRELRVDGPDETSFATAGKYAKTRLSAERKEEIRLKLVELMQQKPYLEPTLTIKEISNATGYPIHHISQVINDVFGENLFAFINRHRVAEAKLRLADAASRDLNVLHIALACGFNSKSSFNTIFKQYTGLTPTEFRRQKLNTPNGS